MIQKKSLIFPGLVVVFCLATSALFGQTIPRKAGIILRGGFWLPQNNEALVSVSTHIHGESVRVGRGSGWLVFFSRVSEQGFLELSIGATAEVGVHSDWYDGDDVDVDGMLPIVIGMRYNLLQMRSTSPLQPYFSFGGGPYFQNRILVSNGFNDENVSIGSKVHPGVYGGVGFDFMLGSWFGFNLDMKYHFINFDTNHDNNGFELGLGLSFQWGRYYP